MGGQNRPYIRYGFLMEKVMSILSKSLDFMLAIENNRNL